MSKLIRKEDIEKDSPTTLEPKGRVVRRKYFSLNYPGCIISNSSSSIKTNIYIDEETNSDYADREFFAESLSICLGLGILVGDTTSLASIYSVPSWLLKMAEQQCENGSYTHPLFVLVSWQILSDHYYVFQRKDLIHSEERVLCDFLTDLVKIVPKYIKNLEKLKIKSYGNSEIDKEFITGEDDSPLSLIEVVDYNWDHREEEECICYCHELDCAICDSMGDIEVCTECLEDIGCQCGCNDIEEDDDEEKEDKKEEDSTLSKSLNRTKSSVLHGAKVAVASEAKNALIGVIETSLGSKFPKSFYKTPLGKCAIDFTSCLAANVGTELFPDMPGAKIVSNGSELAMEAVTRDSLQPVISNLFEIFNLSLSGANSMGLSVMDEEKNCSCGKHDEDTYDCPGDCKTKDK